MTSKSSSALAFAALLANLAFAATGCGAFDGADDSSPAGPPVGAPARTTNDDGSPTPAPPPVGGSANASELTDAFGVFVSPLGRSDADGNHAQPFASIQAGIDRAKSLGKRVYVCSGTFKETLNLADAVSIVGGLDCTANEWRVGNARTRVESPSTPAVRATNIVAPTRIEGLEVIAPDATVASGSSIGLLATDSSGLVIANTAIISGRGMKGDDGTDGIQLANSATANGMPATIAAACVHPTTCKFTFDTGWLRPSPATAGTNTCVGAPAHDAQPGGQGGSGGVWEPVNDVSAFHFHPYEANAANASDIGVTNRTAAAGILGTDGANADALGKFTGEGYTPSSGTTGADGAPGRGGAGGAGQTPEPEYDPNTAAVTGVWRGFGGAGGGAGGCPGLSASAGKGGGASIAALLVDSKLTFDSAEIHSSAGGQAGRGAFGSMPTAGGNRGVNPYSAAMSGKDGGPGGAAGVSGNGSNGPSIAIAHVGPRPDITAASKLIPGPGGAAIDARSRSLFGVMKIIPATPAGLSKDILAL